MTSAGAPLAAVGPHFDWAGAQVALSHEVDRVVSLLRAVRHPTARAVGSWSLTEVAMHLSQVWQAVPGLAAGDLSEIYEEMPSLASRHGDSLIGDMWELGDVTKLGVESDPERDPAVLAERIERRASQYLRECAGRSSLERRPWLVEGVEVALPTLTGHLLNETIVHGRDIALAEGRRWSIDRAHAAMVLDGFLVPVLRALPPATMVDQRRAGDVHAVFDVRIRGGGRYHLVFDGGSLQVAAPERRRVDCHLSMDPAAFLLVTWGRVSQWPAIARGQLTAWGRKPWLGPQLRGFIRNP